MTTEVVSFSTKSVNIEKRWMIYPVKKVNEVFLGPVVGVAFTTDYFQRHHAETVDVCLVREVATHRVFWCHVTTTMCKLSVCIKVLDHTIRTRQHSKTYIVPAILVLM